MIPLNQAVKIKKSGGLDDWGQPKQTQVLTLKARVDYRSRLVRDSQGKEVVSSAKILLKGLVAVSYSDLVEWKDELGTHSRAPLSVSVIKDFTGKPLFTKVVV